MDLLIGVDYAELHYLFKDVRGQPREPVARFTPLGWTCTGTASGLTGGDLQSNFAQMYFVREQSDTDEISTLLRKFWEIENPITSRECHVRSFSLNDALICNIAEMFLRIEVAPKDRSCQRFLWRSMDQQKEPEEFEFNRVVFGVDLSPFQAQFVSQSHAERHKDELPLAAETVSKSTCMDDSMDLVSDNSQGIELYKQFDELWNKAGMHARKWFWKNHTGLSIELKQI